MLLLLHLLQLLLLLLWVKEVGSRIGGRGFEAQGRNVQLHGLRLEVVLLLLLTRWLR